MSSVRNLKKDIDFLVSEIVSDCQLFMFLHPKDKKVETAWKIIEDAIDMRNEMYERANHPNGKHDGKLVKKHYQTLRKDLLATSHKCFEAISALNK